MIDRPRKQQPSFSLNSDVPFGFRSFVCSLFWLTLTRMDIMAVVATLLQFMVTPIMEELVIASKVLVATLVAGAMHGLHFGYYRSRLAFAQSLMFLMSARVPCMLKKQR